MSKLQRFILILLLATAILVAAGIIYQRFFRSELSAFQNQQKIRLHINNHQLQVEVVTTPESITKGLGQRSQIGSDGMLFIFAQPQPLTFWMKDMRFDLDLIWLANHEVVDITENVPAPTSEIENQSANLPLYSPAQLADMVLEVPAGDAHRLQIKKGDRLQF